MSVVEVPIDEIRVPDSLIRGKDALELGDILPSVRKHGILQPILLRPVDGQYELVAGYRRLHAARLAGLKTIPAYIRDIPDGEAPVAELIENIARQALPPHREAQAILEILARRLGVAVEEARRAVYRVANHRKGNRSALPEGADIIEMTFQELGRSFTYFVSDMLPALSWPEDVLEAMEEGLGIRAARQLRKIKDPDLRKEAIERVLKEGEPPEKAVKEVLSEAREVKEVNRLAHGIDSLERWPLDEQGYLVGDRSYEVYAPTMAKALARGNLVRELLARLNWGGRRITMITPDPEDVRDALLMGCRVYWVDSTPHTHQVHVYDPEAEYENSIIFARFGEARSERFGDPREEDYTLLTASDAAPIVRRYDVIVAPIETAHLIGLPIHIVAVADLDRVWAVMGRSLDKRREVIG